MAESEKANVEVAHNTPQTEAYVAGSKSPLMKVQPSSTSVAGNDEYPEGGAKAWGVAIGTSLALFCSLGYVNSFG